ncbi:hypothetical protein HK405_013255, partial [Cladochytrium tenue]
ASTQKTTGCWLEVTTGPLRRSSRPSLAYSDNGRRDGECLPDEVEGTDSEDDDDDSRRRERGGAFCSGTIGMAEVDDK